MSIFVEQYYDHVYRQGAELHTTSWSTINRQFVDVTGSVLGDVSGSVLGDVTGSVLALIDLILTIPATSVEAECGCSVMK